MNRMNIEIERAKRELEIAEAQFNMGQKSPL